MSNIDINDIFDEYVDDLNKSIINCLEKAMKKYPEFHKELLSFTSDWLTDITNKANNKLKDKPKKISKKPLLFRVPDKEKKDN